MKELGRGRKCERGIERGEAGIGEADSRRTCGARKLRERLYLYKRPPAKQLCESFAEFPRKCQGAAHRLFEKLMPG